MKLKALVICCLTIAATTFRIRMQYRGKVSGKDVRNVGQFMEKCSSQKNRKLAAGIQQLTNYLATELKRQLKKSGSVDKFTVHKGIVAPLIAANAGYRCHYSQVRL